MRFLSFAWRIIRWPILVIAAAFLALFIYELYKVPQRTAAAVAEIHATKITKADVDGSKLPPQPDPKLVDATVEGIDANKNGIRDDVELAIYKKYPNNFNLRAAALQYAKTSQLYLTVVDSKETWKAVAEENSRANICVARNSRNSNFDVQTSIGDLVFNSALRVEARDDAFRFITSHGDADGNACDISR